MRARRFRVAITMTAPSSRVSPMRARRFHDLRRRPEAGDRVLLMLARRFAARSPLSSSRPWRLAHACRKVPHNRAQHMTALENVFRALDGAGTSTPHYQSDIETAIGKAGVDSRWSTKYFEGRCFKNHNLHLRFLRLDLLAEFNRRAGGACLRPGTP